MLKISLVRHPPGFYLSLWSDFRGPPQCAQLEIAIPRQDGRCLLFGPRSPSASSGHALFSDEMEDNVEFCFRLPRQDTQFRVGGSHQLVGQFTFRARCRPG